MVQTLTNSLKEAHFYKVVDKKSKPLLKYEFFLFFFSKILSRFP